MKREQRLDMPEKIAKAATAFRHVHGREPALVHLAKIVGTTVHTVSKYKPAVTRSLVLDAEMVEIAKTITVLTEEEINVKKAAAAKAPRRRDRKTREQKLIDAVVAKANQVKSSYDVLHDYRRAWHPRIKASRIG